MQTGEGSDELHSVDDLIGEEDDDDLGDEGGSDGNDNSDDDGHGKNEEEGDSDQESEISRNKGSRKKKSKKEKVSLKRNEDGEDDDDNDDDDEDEEGENAKKKMKKKGSRGRAPAMKRSFTLTEKVERDSEQRKHTATEKDGAGKKLADAKERQKDDGDVKLHVVTGDKHSTFYILSFFFFSWRYHCSEYHILLFIISISKKNSESIATFLQTIPNQS
tara:strand:- start:476 stop:1129 length:654 start_codon:yes stop_codon:yes gene_type:complete